MITTTQTETSNLKADYNFGYIWLISIVAALGGLLFGYDWAVIGGAKPFFERYFHLADAAQSGWANSCALIGCLVGTLVAGARAINSGVERGAQRQIDVIGAIQKRRRGVCRQYLEVSFVALCSQSWSAARRIIATAANHLGAFGAGPPSGVSLPTAYALAAVFLEELQK